MQEIGVAAPPPPTRSHFHGVYLLYSKNEKYLGRTYIGYTTNPTRRIKQHNRGKKAGGARRTSEKGPWLMVLIIHGFPNDITALRVRIISVEYSPSSNNKIRKNMQFEWAWQHPQLSRRLQHHHTTLTRKSKEKPFDYNLRIVGAMLQVGPWHRLPLTVRWLNVDFARDFKPPPPMHMPIFYGAIRASSKTKTSASVTIVEDGGGGIQCDICSRQMEAADKTVHCLNYKCIMVGHLICWGRVFLLGDGDKDNNYVPIEGRCPKCGETYLWGDLVRKYKGCYYGGNNDDLVIIGDGKDDEETNYDCFYSSSDSDS